MSSSGAAMSILGGLALLASLYGCPASAQDQRTSRAAGLHQSQAKPQPAGAHHRRTQPRRRASSSPRRAFLVPPPPAYLPSILPEMYMRHQSEAPATESVEVVKPENPYERYFYSAQSDVPKAVQSRSGVAVWSRDSSTREKPPVRSL